MAQIASMEKAQEAMAQISSGAFLTIKTEDVVNTMTIGWAQIGIIWGRPIFMVAVRPTRHSFRMIEISPDFTVSIPWEDMTDALTFCGTKSGRDCDKFKECNLTKIDGLKTTSPIIAMKGLHYECKIVLRQEVNSARLDDELDKFYPAHDYHTLYFGEIVACYETEK